MRKNKKCAYYCQNPECGNKIEESKWKYRPKYCNKKCWRQHLQILRGNCEACGKPIPAHTKNKNYCSLDCYRALHFIPHSTCALEGCENQVKRAGKKYCSFAHACQAGEFLAASKKGNMAQAAYKEEHGYVPGYQRRREAVQESNRTRTRTRHKAKTATNGV